MGALPRTISFVDGQNLFYCAHEVFGYTYPNFDVKALSTAICREQGWRLMECRFYTGLHHPKEDFFWYTFWTKKFAQMGRQGIKVISRVLRYQEVKTTRTDGTESAFRVGHEKGIDVRIALDEVKLARENFLDVVLLFSQDQDLAEVADEVKAIAQSQGRRIVVASAYPYGPQSGNKRGVDRTNWIRIDKALYDQCLDSRDYRV